VQTPPVKTPVKTAPVAKAPAPAANKTTSEPAKGAKQPPKALTTDERVKNIIDATDGWGTDEDSFLKNIMAQIKYDEKTGYGGAFLPDNAYKEIDQQLVTKHKKGLIDILKNEFGINPEENSYESGFTDKETRQNELTAILYDRLVKLGLKEHKK